MHYVTFLPVSLLIDDLLYIHQSGYISLQYFTHTYNLLCFTSTIESGNRQTKKVYTIV